MDFTGFGGEGAKDVGVPGEFWIKVPKVTAIYICVYHIVKSSEVNNIEG